MTKNKVRNIRIVLNSNIMELLFVLQIGHVAAGMRITKVTSIVTCFAMTQMIISINHKACLLEFANHMQITTGMLTIAMNKLNNTANLAQGAVGPSLNGISAISRRKTNLTN